MKIYSSMMTMNRPQKTNVQNLNNKSNPNVSFCAINTGLFELIKENPNDAIKTIETILEYADKGIRVDIINKKILPSSATAKMGPTGILTHRNSISETISKFIAGCKDEKIKRIYIKLQKRAEDKY